MTGYTKSDWLQAPIDFQYRPPKDDPVVRLRDAMMRLDGKWPRRAVYNGMTPYDSELYSVVPASGRKGRLLSYS